MTDDAQIKDMVRARYGSIAEPADAAGCCAPASSCCEGAPATAAETSRQMGYSEAELAAAPDGANLGLGCRNPQAIAAMQPGETVIDLGSGAGFDCVLAAGQVGDTGHVIGVDMTLEMLEGAEQRLVDRRDQRRIPPRRNRAPADRRQDRRRGDLELRDQPRAG